MNNCLLNAYTKYKKDVRIISHNEPLLFVHGPPVFIRIDITDEESTSVFVSNGEELTELNDAVLEEVQTPVLANPSIRKKITDLGKPFQRQIYRPLKFVIGDEIVSGGIEKVDGETVVIELDGEKDVIIAVEISTIEEVIWRGKPFEER